MAAAVKKDAAKSLRLSAIIDLLNKRTPFGGITVKELAQKMEVSERQIYRDLKSIEDGLRVPLVREGSGGAVRVRLKAAYLPSLSPEQATVVLLCLLQQKGTALSGYLNEIKDTLIATLFKYRYNPAELAPDKLQKRIHIVEERLADPLKVGEIFSCLVDALRASYRVKIWYFSAHRGEKGDRVVEPYGLICKHHNWYLVGRCLKRNDVRVFRVDQITDVFPYRSECFLYPEDFSLEDYMASSWGVISDGSASRVLIRFDKSVAHRVQRIIYHPSQKIEEILDDGSVKVSFEVCGLAEMTGWLLQWGEAAEVLEPPHLREQVRQVAEKIASLYALK